MSSAIETSMQISDMIHVGDKIIILKRSGKRGYIKQYAKVISKYTHHFRVLMPNKYHESFKYIDIYDQTIKLR